MRSFGAVFGVLTQDFGNSHVQAQVLFIYEESRIGPEALTSAEVGKSRQTATGTGRLMPHVMSQKRD